MSILRSTTIKHKLILIIMLTCITALVLAGVIAIAAQWTNVRQNMVRNLSIHAQMTAENCKAALAFEDTEDAEETLRALHVESSIVFACIQDRDGGIFASYYRDENVSRVLPVELELGVSEMSEGWYNFSEGFLTVLKPVILGDEVIGRVCLRLDLQPMYRMLKRNIAITIAVLIVVSMVAYPVSSRLQRIISGPILTMAESAAKIGSGELSHSVKIHSKDELGYLATSFNNMASRLKESYTNLEKKVQQRTAELTTANESLTQEIAVRKEIEEQLRKAEEKYRTQFEGALDAIVVADAETGIIVDCNPAASRLIARERSELIGQHQRTLHPPDTIKGGFSRTFKEHLEDKKGQTLETQVITKTGEKRDVAITASLIESGGKRLLQGIFRDITDRKRAEQRQAQLLEQLEKTNQELKDFAYIVSHDLKAPLRGIKTLADWISTDYAEKLGDEGKEQVKLLVSRVDRMHSLIEGVLQYSRVGRTEEEKVMVNLNELVAEVIDLIAPPDNIAISIENKLPTIECEQTPLMQIFQNLLSNAVKYIDKPKGQIKIGCVEENGFWKFNVTDNGPGIEERYFEKIFKIFQTLSPRDEFESTGIGLTVIKKIIEMYGGKIWVQSKIGEGSTFFFTLPKVIKSTDNVEKLLTPTP